MITQLTAEQERQIPSHVDKWIKIGLSCEPCDVEKAKEAVGKSYKLANLKPPSLFFVFDSPVSAVLGKIYLNNMEQSVRGSVWRSVWQSVRQSVGESVGESVWRSVWQSVRRSVEDSVWQSVGESVGQSVEESVGESVRQSVWESVEDSVWQSVGDSVWQSVRQSVEDLIYGSHDTGWLSFYAFFRNVCGLELETEKLIGLIELANVCGWWAPYKNVAILQHRHCEVHKNDRGLHRDGGPAVLYRDGFAVWALNGVRVGKKVAETPADKLSAKLLLTENNAEIRREIINKIGIERALQELKARTIEKSGDYELLMLDLGDSRIRPFLKMKNPSIDAWHIEGVHPDCVTIRGALNFRNQDDLETIILT